MRNFRTAAVAAATAATVAFSGTAIASAEEQGSASNNETTQSSTGSSAWEIGKDLGVQDDPDVKGVDLFGSSIDEDATPEWAKVWREGTYLIAGTAVLGAIIGAYNYAVHEGILPNHILDPVFGIK